jgi:uncharacterized protein (TIGR02145 family)
MNSFKKNIYRTESEDIVLCPDCVAHDVTIGIQVWTGCNADTEYYTNGDLIPNVTDPAVWITLTTGAWCYYNNDPTTEATYGKLYNWYAINDPRGLAPTGYHVPTDTEWTTLISFLGGNSIGGGKLKEAGLCHWLTPNTGATNSSGFTGLPAGVRRATDGTFISSAGYWWTSTDFSPFTNAIVYSLFYYTDYIGSSGADKKYGASVRFIKN